MAFSVKLHNEAIAVRQLLDLTCRSLDLTWKLSVAAIVVAICLRTPMRLNYQAEWYTANAVQPVKTESTSNYARIFTQLPEGKDTLQIVICDPLGKESLLLVYGPRGISHYHARNPDSLHFGYSTSSNYDEVFNIRTPGAFYRIAQERSGNSSVDAETNAVPRKGIFHLKVTNSRELSR